MKYLKLALIGFLFVASFAYGAEAVQAPSAPVIVPLVDISTSTLIERYSALYDVSEATMKHIVLNESTGSTTIQSYSRYTRDHPEWGVKKGDRELSFGLSQIHLPSHPEVTYEQAIDPVFAINFLAKNLSKKKCGIWMTCPLKDV